MKGGRTRPRARRSSLEPSFGEGREVRVDCLGGAAAVREGGDDEVGAVDVVAAREDAGTRRHVRVRVHFDEVPAIRRDAGRCFFDRGVGVVADGDGDSVGGNDELRMRDGDRAAAA